MTTPSSGYLYFGSGYGTFDSATYGKIDAIMKRHNGHITCYSDPRGHERYWLAIPDYGWLHNNRAVALAEQELREAELWPLDSVTEIEQIP